MLCAGPAYSNADSPYFIKEAMKPHIVGSVTHGPHTIDLANVFGIYSDRSSARKVGYWVRSKDVDGKLVKTFYENMSSRDRLLISAASRFNQVVERCSIVEGLLYREAE